MAISYIKCIYQTRHTKIRAYKNLVWDLIENIFDAFNIIVVPRDLSHHPNALALDTSTFNPP